MTAQTVVHIAGTPVQVGSIHRQLCCWCGASLIDDDWALIASTDGGGPMPWAVGSLVRVTARSKVELRTFDEGATLDPADMPHDWCGAAPLPDNVVRMVRNG